MMRALPIAGLLMLAACGDGVGLGQSGGLPATAAVTALRDGAPQVAVQIDDAVLAKDPRNIAALLNRGDAQTALQQPDAAVESYIDALQADPHSVLARIGLGRLRLAADPAAAAALFLEASQADPANAVAWNDLGIARDMLGYHRDAQAAYRQAIGLDASMRGAQVNFALSVAMTGRAAGLEPMPAPPGALTEALHDPAAVRTIGSNRAEATGILGTNPPPTIARAATPATAPATLSTPSPSVGATSVASGATPPAAILAATVDVAPPPQHATEVAAPPAPEASVAPTHAGTTPPTPSVTSPLVVLTATADAWMQVRDRSGQVLLSRILHSGDSWPVPARQNLLLTTGNAGGTDILIDGAPIASLGASGAVRRDIPLNAGLLAAANSWPMSRPIATASAGPPAAPTAPASTPSPSAGAASATENAAPPAATLAAASDVAPTPRREAAPTASRAVHSSAPSTQAAALAPPATRARPAPSAAADATSPADRGSDGELLAASVSPGMRALTVGVDGFTGTTGLIWPGDRVDLILTQGAPGGVTPVGQRVAAAMVLSKARVIAVDQPLAPGAMPGTSKKPARTVTFEVDHDQAERVAVATRLGRLWLAARSDDSADQASEPPPASPTRWASEALSLPRPNAAPDANHVVHVFPGAADSKEFRF